MQQEQSSPALQHNHRSAWAQAQGERKTKGARGLMSKPSVVLEQRLVPEPSVLLEPEDIPIPDTDDLFIDILTEQMIDFDERSTDVAGALRMETRSVLKLTRGK